MKKLPPLPKLRATTNGSNGKVRRLAVVLPGDRESLPPRKRREPVHIEASRRQLEEDLKQLSADKSETDKKIEEMRPRIALMKAEQDNADRKSKLLTTEEKVIILEAHFGNGIGAKVIGKELGRDPSVITRFLQRYRSSVPMAKLYMQANAEKLAERVVRKANVQEALEVLDRVDALPKRERKQEGLGNQFNIIVGTPGQQTPAGPVSIPIPDQKTIEAAAVKSKED